MTAVGSLRIASMAGFLVLGAGCGAENVVASRFSQQFSCPRSQVTVTQRPSHPPPDVAADPERLKLYQKEQVPVFFAKGCDTERFYMCVWWGQGSQNVCDQGSATPPPPGAKFSAAMPE